MEYSRILMTKDQEASARSSGKRFILILESDIFAVTSVTGQRFLLTLHAKS